jgi:pre-mRNA-processing factor 40
MLMQERLREASEDGASTTSRKRKEPPRDHRDGERERERSEKYREPERDGHRVKDFERDGRSRPAPRGHDEYDGPSHRVYPRERDRDRERDKNQSRERDRDKDSCRSSRHHRESEKDDKRRDRKSSRAEYGSISRGEGSGRKRDERERSASVYGEEPPEKKKATQEDGADKVWKFDFWLSKGVIKTRCHQRLAREREREEAFGEVANGDAHSNMPRAETPEEGEI